MEMFKEEEFESGLNKVQFMRTHPLHGRASSQWWFNTIEWSL